MRISLAFVAPASDTFNAPVVWTEPITADALSMGSAGSELLFLVAHDTSPPSSGPPSRYLYLEQIAIDPLRQVATPQISGHPPMRDIGGYVDAGPSAYVIRRDTPVSNGEIVVGDTDLPADCDPSTTWREIGPGMPYSEGTLEQAMFSLAGAQETALDQQLLMVARTARTSRRAATTAISISAAATPSS